MKKKLNALISKANNTFADVLSNNGGAALWEYLLVIAIVCIIGAALITALQGSNGIGALWNGLYAKLSGLIGLAPGAGG